VDADLDRLLSAARDHAHVAPAAAEVEFARPAAITAEELPPVAHLRGYRVLDRVGKVAAVFVLVVGVGGAVVMRPAFDGSTGIPAILGPDDNDEGGLYAANADEVADGWAGLAIDDVESTRSSDDADQGGGSDATQATEGSGAPAPQEAPTGTNSGGSTNEGATDGSTGGSGSTGAGPGSTAAPKPSPSGSSPKPSPSPTAEPSEDPDGFDGFGGGRLCPTPPDAEADPAEGENADDTDRSGDGEKSEPDPCVPPKPSDEPDDGESDEPSAEADEEEASQDEGPPAKLRPKLPGDPPERGPRA
jgi:hypothetical protein